VSEIRPRPAPVGLIDAGITGNPEIAGIDSPRGSAAAPSSRLVRST